MLDASMGPRLNSRGNLVEKCQKVSGYAGLQWGRDLIVAEMQAGIRTLWQVEKLQWGRDLIVAEILRQFVDDINADMLQWGRDLIVAEMQALC